MFYIVMALENALLMFVWSFGTGDMVKPLVALGLFCCGLVFMAIYYQFFHVRRLKYESGGRLSNATNSNTSTAKLALEAKYKDQLNAPNGGKVVDGCQRLSFGLLLLLLLFIGR